MAEEVNTSGQQDNPGQQAQTPSASPTEEWKKRYDGAVRKIEELVGQVRKLEAELAQSRTQIEQLNAQLGLKDAEKQAAVGERDKQIQELVGKSQQLEGEMARLKALELKISVAKELGRPDLIKIAERIPDLTDKEALTVVMKDIVSFADEAVAEREKQLLAGVSVTAGTSQGAPKTPQSEEAWERYIDSLPLGSIERARAMDDYGDWLFQQHRR